MSSGSSEATLGFQPEEDLIEVRGEDDNSSQFFSVKSNHSQISEAPVVVERIPDQVPDQLFDTDSELPPKPAHRNQSSVALPFLRAPDLKITDTDLRHPSYGFTPKLGLKHNTFLFPPPEADRRYMQNLHSIHSQEVPMQRSASKHRPLGPSSGSSGKPNPLEFAQEIARNMHTAHLPEEATEDLRRARLGGFQSSLLSQKKNVTMKFRETRSGAYNSINQNESGHPVLRPPMKYETTFTEPFEHSVNRQDLPGPPGGAHSQQQRAPRSLSFKQALYFSYSCMSKLLPIYYLATSIVFMFCLYKAYYEAVNLGSATVQLHQLEREAHLDGTPSQEWDSVKTLQNFSADMKSSFVYYMIVVSCSGYLVLQFLISLFIYYLSMNEGRDLIAFSFIFMMLQRAVVTPCTIYMVVVSYFKFDSLSKTAQDFGMRNPHLGQIVTFLKEQIDTSEGILELYAIILAFGVFEVIVTSLGFTLSQICQRIKKNQSVVYELSNEDMCRGRVDVDSSFNIDVLDHFKSLTGKTKTKAAAGDIETGPHHQQQADPLSEIGKSAIPSDRLYMSEVQVLMQRNRQGKERGMSRGAYLALLHQQNDGDDYIRI